MSERINARLPPEVARKVAYLERVTAKSTTLVVRDSIELYYAAVTKEAGAPADLFAQAGFIGCAEGPTDLSSSYKPAYAASLKKKT